MPDLHKNLAISAVATAPSPAVSGTSLVVTAGHGTRFPTAPFNATVWPTGAQPDPANAEIVRVTARTTDTLTITRAQEGTTARTVVAGDQIAAGITAKTLTDVESTSSALFYSPPVGSEFTYPHLGAFQSIPFWLAASLWTWTWGHPIIVPVSCNVDAITFYLDALAADANARIRTGLYAAGFSTAQALPTTLIQDAGEVDVSTATGTVGGKAATFTARAITPGVYWLWMAAYRTDGTTPSTAALSVGASATINAWGAGVMAQGVNRVRNGYVANDMRAGMQATLGTPTIDNDAARAFPAMGLRRSA